jgi:hypothetical protein
MRNEQALCHCEHHREFAQFVLAPLRRSALLYDLMRHSKENRPRLRYLFQNRTQRQHCSATMSAVADKQQRLRSGAKVRFE